MKEANDNKGEIERSEARARRGRKGRGKVEEEKPSKTARKR